MRDAHAKVSGSTVRFEFRGKSGIRHAVGLNDRRLAAIVKACRDLPGYELFQHVDGDGARQVIDSCDVNAYLREICCDDFTAKDFRTWSGTVLAARALAGVAGFATQREAKRKVVQAIESVARFAREYEDRLPQVVRASCRDRRLYGRRDDSPRKNARPSVRWLDRTDSRGACRSRARQRSAAAQDRVSRAEARAPQWSEGRLS
jgi:DNA topoisomerase IB